MNLKNRSVITHENKQSKKSHYSDFSASLTAHSHSNSIPFIPQVSTSTPMLSQASFSMTSVTAATAHAANAVSPIPASSGLQLLAIIEEHRKCHPIAVAVFFILGMALMFKLLHG